MSTWIPEYSSVPEHLRGEQRAVENEIFDAFNGITREGGVSWSEAEAIDAYETEVEQSVARSRDIERIWEDLVDDPAWDDESGMGGFNFLDAIGWRYYIAPAMIRCARRGSGESVSFALERSSVEDIACLNTRQSKAVTRFVRFMVAVHKANDDDIYGRGWQNAYDSHWRRHET